MHKNVYFFKNYSIDITSIKNLLVSHFMKLQLRWDLKGRTPGADLWVNFLDHNILKNSKSSNDFFLRGIPIDIYSLLTL